MRLGSSFALAWAARAALALSLGLSAGCTPTPRDGAFSCVTNADCPFGYPCVGGRCRSGIGTECQRAVDCTARQPPCTEASCESGYCIFMGDSARDGDECNDGIVCDGPDRCASGTCAPVGILPCPDVCTEDAACGDCGRLGTACCDIVFPGVGSVPSCFDESVCDTLGRCVSCGVPDGACCLTNPQCGDGTGCTNVEDPANGTCVTCGGLDQPCCSASGMGIEPDGLPSCNDFGLACDPSFRCVPCGGPDAPACADGCGPGLYATFDFICRAPADCACSLDTVCTDPLSGTCELPGEGPCVPGPGPCVDGSCGGSCTTGAVCSLGRCDLVGIATAR